ncbi:MAG: glycoside hydrolase family 13 protein [Treponema sp.]|nr:glycoside hydrolase family 13 protein [Treponema sp.]
MMLEHRAALPWCRYDEKQGKITFRLLCSGGVEAAELLWGDPYDWRDSGGGIRKWHYAETGMRRQLSGTGPETWRAEIDLPVFRRLKYGFRVRNAMGEWFFSENGIEPYGEPAVNSAHGHFVYPFVHGIDAPKTPEWAEGTVWYQIFPDRFRRGPGTRDLSPTPSALEDWETGRPSFRNFFGGDLAGIAEKLPWLAELGINGLYLTPVFQSPSNHKYNTEDYFAVDPRFGDIDGLKALVARAHGLGMRVMLDAVFNHAGDTHPFWRDVLENQENSPYRDHFHIRRFPVRRPEQNPDARDLDYHAFSWVARMPKWNTENPAARRHLLEAAEYWIKECDIDGWRLDVANEVSADFWKAFSGLVRSLKKDFYIVGEIWHDASGWINTGLFDAVMNYPVKNAVSDCFLEKKTSPGDFTRRLFAVLTRYGDSHNRVGFNLLDSHDTDRALTRAKGDMRALRNAFAMLFLLPGSPCIYYGTEVGMEGGADPDCRRPMVWDAEKQDGELRRFFGDLIRFRKKHLHIIADAEVSYAEIRGGRGGPVHRWEFSRGGESLVAAYTERDAAFGFAVPGTLVLGPGPDMRDIADIPPYTMNVYSCHATPDPGPGPGARDGRCDFSPADAPDVL